MLSPFFFPLLLQTHPSTKTSGVSFCYITVGTSATKILPHQKGKKQPKAHIVGVAHSAFKKQIFRATRVLISFLTASNVAVVFPWFLIQNINNAEPLWYIFLLFEEALDCCLRNNTWKHFRQNKFIRIKRSIHLFRFTHKWKLQMRLHWQVRIL